MGKHIFYDKNVNGDIWSLKKWFTFILTTKQTYTKKNAIYVPMTMLALVIIYNIN